MKFLADECFFIATVKTLRSAGYEVDTILERGLSGLNDRDIIRLCVKEGLILLTFDNDFSNIFLFPIGSNPGVILIKIRPETVEESTPAILSFLNKNRHEIFQQGLTIITR